MKKHSIVLLLAGIFSVGLSFAQKREIVLQGTYNFRDIGGYKTKDGKYIKWGKIYRSAVLSNLTSEDLQLLQVLGIGSVIDFRGPKETSIFPDKIPARSNYVTLVAGSENDEPDDWESTAKEMMHTTEKQSDDGAIAYYKNIQSFGERYRPMFDLLLSNAPDSAVVFHCAGGKDRTGIAAALIEYVLGVDEKHIMEDYLVTNKYRQRYNEEIAQLLHLKYGVPIARAQLYGLAKPAFLEASFNEIKKKYGSMDHFVTTELGLDQSKIDQLRAMYLTY
ncbi:MULTISPECIES: tyrosine-protein phosphatase [Chitinophagaceae]